MGVNLINHVQTNRVSFQVELKLDPWFTKEEREEMVAEMKASLKALPFTGYIHVEVDV